MIDNKRILAVIAARGGSKGLPGKNVREIGGKPMIAWTIAAGRGSRYLDRMILSTDDETIIAHARRFGCDVPFKRPAALATDKAAIEDCLIHALDTLGAAEHGGESFDYVVLLQATSPLRLAEDIDGCIETCIREGAPAVLSVNVPRQSPYWMMDMEPDRRLKPLVPADAIARRRQELPVVYAPNGAVYVARVDWFRETRRFMSEETVGHVMPPERSVDVDTEIDLVVAAAFMARRREELDGVAAAIPAQ